MIGAVVYQTLTADAAVTALIGNRCHPNRAPQGEKEASVTYNQVSAPREYLSTGAVISVRTRMDIKCHAAEGMNASHYQQAHTIKRAVEKALRTLHNTTVAGVLVYDAMIDNAIDLYDDQIHQHSVLLNVEFHHCQPE